MIPRLSRSALSAVVVIQLLGPSALFAAEPPEQAFPVPLDQYGEPAPLGIAETLKHRVVAEPFNLVATLIFSLAIVHTFLAPKFMHIAHRSLLLARHFYRLNPSARLWYGTLGILFVNVSVGGTLTHFAAPPVLLVASKWQWNTGFMLTHFGWKALLGIAISNLPYFIAFRREFAGLRESLGQDRPPEHRHEPGNPVPGWVTGVHIFFLAWTVFTAHYPALFIGGFLFFLVFTTATEAHQAQIDLRPALLVGFFLAGLVIHGGLQGWWIEPVLASLNAFPLMLGAMTLTAFNDNAVVTYLATLVPAFTAELKYAVVAGAVAGGGLTVIANAPNPAGQSILSPYFEDGVSPFYLALGALPATVVMMLCFLLIR